MKRLRTLGFDKDVQLFNLFNNLSCLHRFIQLHDRTLHTMQSTTHPTAPHGKMAFVPDVASQKKTPYAKDEDIPRLVIPESMPYWHVAVRPKHSDSTMTVAEYEVREKLSENVHRQNELFYRINPAGYQEAVWTEVRELRPANESANEIVLYYIRLNTLIADAKNHGVNIPLLEPIWIFLLGIREFYDDFIAEKKMEIEAMTKAKQRLPCMNDVLQDLNKVMIRQFGRHIDRSLSVAVNAIRPTSKTSIYRSLAVRSMPADQRKLPVRQKEKGLVEKAVTNNALSGMRVEAAKNDVMQDKAQDEIKALIEKKRKRDDAKEGELTPRPSNKAPRLHPSQVMQEAPASQEKIPVMQSVAVQHVRGFERTVINTALKVVRIEGPKTITAEEWADNAVKAFVERRKMLGIAEDDPRPSASVEASMDVPSVDVSPATTPERGLNGGVKQPSSSNMPAARPLSLFADESSFWLEPGRSVPDFPPAVEDTVDQPMQPTSTGLEDYTTAFMLSEGCKKHVSNRPRATAPVLYPSIESDAYIGEEVQQAELKQSRSSTETVDQLFRMPSPEITDEEFFGGDLYKATFDD